MPYRIFLVEDHPVMQEGYARLINREADVELCGRADSGVEALHAIPEAFPDLAVVDLSIPGMNGLDLLKQLRVSAPQVRCLVVTAHSEALYAERAIRAGAHGFLNKDAPPSEILVAIRTVLGGERYLSPALRDRLDGQSSDSDSRVPENALEVLTDRELEVFRHFGLGCSTSQTAEALFISPKTVETHRENIKRKLGLDRANEVIQRATLWVESLTTTV